MMTKTELIDAYWNGRVGDVEFAEVGICLGMEALEISHVMCLVRAEDGTL